MARALGRALGHGKPEDAIDPTNPDAPIPVTNWSERLAYVLPSFFSLAALLIKINNFLKSKAVSVVEVDVDGRQHTRLVIPDTYDAEVTAVIPFVILLMGPSQRPGQIYTLKSPWAQLDPMNMSNYILCTRATRAGKTVYSFHADCSLFKRDKYDRHKAQYSGFFNTLLYHYFFRVYKRNAVKTKSIPGIDPRLFCYACTDPSFKPYRTIDAGGIVTDRSDSSRVMLSAFKAAIDNLLGEGTAEQHQIHKINNVYSTRVLTFAKNHTPGSLSNIRDLALSNGVMCKDDFAKNRAELEDLAKIQEAIGLSGCQVQYDYRNGNNHVDNACSIFFSFKMVEIMIKNDPTNHILKMEEKRQKRQIHPECLPVYQSVEITSLDINDSPLQTSPIVNTPPAIEDVVKRLSI